MDPVSFAAVFALGTDVHPSPQSPPPAAVSPAEVAEKITPAIKLVPAPTKVEPIPGPPAPAKPAPAPAPQVAAPAPVQRPVIYRAAPQPQYYPQQYNWFYPNTYSAGGCANGRCGR